jgi:hypothetical protein
MITSFQDLFYSRPPWSTVLIWYLRAMALLSDGRRRDLLGPDYRHC